MVQFMNNNWNDELFNEWLSLREKFRKAKKDKNYNEVIKICENIIILDKNAKFIKIMVPLFQKEIGNAHLKLGNNKDAKGYYNLAIEGFKLYRKEKSLKNSNDWLKDIDLLENKLKKLN
ncbi:MAG: hypothetical protein A2086_01650 [Spirochaetes bacterium GWD1_27_9]|nr:MAG: hypothetical protein A2Z98_04080 [Spirochaetes bacterium GWB1_27_13]OHD20626.1 MAG: hypothetical protein A2Y34_17560 [Spirochaetes bacterium GWC1_27_15]OHD41807.1 MAG: hypothetical protein A2086_01650 [Spirochaetes bacterium GWD1_27_9]